MYYDTNKNRLNCIMQSNRANIIINLFGYGLALGKNNTACWVFILFPTEVRKHSQLAMFRFAIFAF